MSTVAFNLLSPQIRKYIHSSGWSEIRPIQDAAIKYIINTRDNYIISAATASGKTEAAFLPVLSLCYPDSVQTKKGVKILYISPLIALINDQFERVGELCKYLNVKVTKWHGEAKISEKKKLFKNPEGIVLITPESIEALFANKPVEVKNIFSDIDFIVIDEIHNFIGSDRGVHLQSLLFRLQEINKTPIRFIGLSATLGNYDIAKAFFGNSEKTKIIKDASINPITVEFKFIEQKTQELNSKIISELYAEVSDCKTLIFPNSRARVEDITVKLTKLSRLNFGHDNYFPHHSSISKESRLFAESFAKKSIHDNFSIICTSTLELGVDIGSVDKVVQIGKVGSVSSLAQRLGRSGRKSRNSKLTVYNLNKWELLQNIASYELLQEGFSETEYQNKRYDILVHQVLSILKETGGISRSLIVNKVSSNWAFCDIDTCEIDEIINHLISIDLVEDLNRELILGFSSQYIVNSRDFYSMFEVEKGYRVINNGKYIGEIASPDFGQEKSMIGSNIFLTGKIWKIIDVDTDHKKFYAIKANDGKSPQFTPGESSRLSYEVARKMESILLSSQNYFYINNECEKELTSLRLEFEKFKSINTKNEKIIVNLGEKINLYLFEGQKNQITLEFVAKSLKHDTFSSSSSFPGLEINLNYKEFVYIWNSLKYDKDKIKAYISNWLNEKHTNEFTKYSKYLPLKIQTKLFVSLYMNVDESERILSNYKFKDSLG